MKTVSIGVENLCVPCNAHCRYCLLSSCKRATGVEYERGKRFAARLYDEIKSARPDLKLTYYIGYCMDLPQLPDYIGFCRKIGAPSGDFLQLNGLRMRDEPELDRFMREIRDAGIKLIDLTFYGTQSYHDKFAGRSGDFDYLVRILKAAKRTGIMVKASAPLTRENQAQAERLVALLEACRADEILFFLPHGKGRGKQMNDLRLTVAELDRLSGRIKTRFPKDVYRTERDWLKADVREPDSRVLTLSFQPDQIDRLELMPLGEIVAYLEALDDRYYAALPSVKELAVRYGDSESDRLYRFRDLYLEWQQRFLADSKEKIWDMNDETHHFSVRY